MTLHVHKLSGCAPTPLAHYLKALGVLRLIAEQKDDSVRGWWRDETFYLATTLSRSSLEQFFLDEYEPTPLIAPWNGGSGFYPKDNKAGIDPITNSRAPRFAMYRAAISLAKEATDGMKESPKDEIKSALQRRCRATWRGPLANWLEAAIVLTDEGSPTYPALLGTGGNDGRLDFTNNFMQRLVELLDCETEVAAARPVARPWLGASLFAAPAAGLESKSIGQFFPGAAGGANSSVGFGSGSLVNSWDFVLMLEGALLFASGATRRVTTESLPQASAPFAVFGSASGYASAADGEKNRGEQWMPLWSRPASHREIVGFIGEGRCQIPDSSSRSRSAQRPLDVARAIARLGVARGVDAFQRYGYIERNGQANLATPLGRWRVPTQPVANLELIDQIKPWFDKLQACASDKNAPESICRATRVCENAMLACCREGAGATRWQQLFVALGDAESQLVRSPGFTADKGLQPLGAFTNGLSVGWLRAINDRSPELRLALALAGQHGVRLRSSGSVAGFDGSNPVRRHFLPLEEMERRTPRRFAVAGEKLKHDPAVVCVSGDLETDAIELMRRRIIEGRQAGGSVFPLRPVNGTEASLEDVLAFLNGDVDPLKILRLARPLMALDWQAFSSSANELQTAMGFPSRDDEYRAADALALYGLLRLCHHGEPITVTSRAGEGVPSASANELRRPTGVLVRLDPSIFARLTSGEPRSVQSAVQLAARRLAVSGLRPKLTTAIATAATGRRLAAALAFPIGPSAARLLASRLTRPTFRPDDVEEAVSR